MFGIGWTELILIALVLLIFVGPRQLPGVLKKLGGIVAELRSASRELQIQVSDEMREIRKDVGDVPSLSKFARDMAEDLIAEGESPYDEVRAAEEEARAEIDSIKADLVNEGDRGTAESPPETDRQADGDDSGKPKRDNGE